MLYQKGTETIRIIISKEGGADNAGAKEMKTENMSAQGNNNEEVMQATGVNNVQRYGNSFLKTNITHTLAVAKQATDLGLEYWVSGVGQRNGDNALQEQIGRDLEILKDSTGFASSIGIGLTYGSVGGVPGMAIGAILGAVSSGASLVVKYMNRQRDFSYEVFKENNAIEYQRARANINMTNGRLR